MEKQLLKKLFDSLNNSECNYCVLRNYETLPESLGGSDLDLAVLPVEEEAVYLLIREVVNEYGGGIILEYNGSLTVLRCLGCHQNEWWGLAIDLFSSIQYKGVEYISTNSLINRAVDYKGIKVANNYDANIVALAKELLTNGKSRKDYFPRAAELQATIGKNSLVSLQDSFAPETVSYFEEILTAGVEDPDKIGKLVSMMRHDILGSKSLSKAAARIKNIISRCRRLVHPPGMCIALLGTDGAGKTTMIDAITPILEQALHNKIQYEHMRPNWLPAIGVAMGQRAEADGSAVTDPHSHQPSGFIGSLARLIYYSLDYTVGYWVKIYPRLVKCPHICLFDRYHYDLLLDPRRMRIALPQWVIRMVLFCAPQPRVVICLGGEPKAIYVRKPETSLVEVRRQVNALKAFCTRNSRAVWIDTEGSINNSKNQVMNAFLSKSSK